MCPRGAIWEKCLYFICPGRVLVEYIPANRPQNLASRYHITLEEGLAGLNYPSYRPASAE